MQPEACAAAGEALPVEAIGGATDSTVREGAMEGVLHVVGEGGYRVASVRAVLEYSGGHRRQFYENFESLEDCFAQACAAWIEQLGLNLLEAAVGVEGWRSQVRAALTRLFQLVVEKPEIARALFVEVHVAGGRALAAHDEGVERFARALDSVREELGPDAAPPRETGTFVVGGIEAYLCEVLSEGSPERIWDGLPEVMRMVVGAYLDPQAAQEEAEKR
ncbi:MAG TPA: TetR/AcrR family transcriptional regulator [Solirubrobacterales bacterium]|nr:TetR/AcrR family transcriptional regulator [Solirubrobacterales bacterium]